MTVISPVVSQTVLLSDGRMSSIYTGNRSRTPATTWWVLLFYCYLSWLQAFTNCPSKKYLRCFWGLQVLLRILLFMQFLSKKNSLGLIYIFKNNFDKVTAHLVYLCHATIFQDFCTETPDFCIHAQFLSRR